MDPLIFLPAPDNWKQILKLPSIIQKHWANALLIEIKELIKKGTFASGKPNNDDPIIPVTSKYRVKLSPDGSIEKLKARIALRGDLMRDNVVIPDTWCPIAGFRSFKIFLAMAARIKQRIYQLDYVAAFKPTLSEGNSQYYHQSGNIFLPKTLKSINGLVYTYSSRSLCMGIR